MDAGPTIQHLTGSYQLQRHSLLELQDDPNPMHFWILKGDGPILGHFPETEAFEELVVRAKAWLASHVYEAEVDGTVYTLHHIPVAETLPGSGLEPQLAVWYVTGAGRLAAQFPTSLEPDFPGAVQQLRKQLGHEAS